MSESNSRLLLQEQQQEQQQHSDMQPLMMSQQDYNSSYRFEQQPPAVQQHQLKQEHYSDAEQQQHQQHQQQQQHREAREQPQQPTLALLEARFDRPLTEVAKEFREHICTAYALHRTDSMYAYLIKPVPLSCVALHPDSVANDDEAAVQEARHTE
eukprot:18154-Heterococcus_DN1.PRE.2